MIKKNTLEETASFPKKVKSLGIVYKDRFKKIRKIVAEFNKFTKTYFVSVYPPRAAVIVYEKGKILLTRQYRLFSKDLSYEIPGGQADKKETPKKAALRECLEETGCEVSKVIPIQGYFPAPGSSESYYHIFLGEIEGFDEERIMGLDSENENILVKAFKVDQVRKMLKNKEIKNGLTLIALQWFFLEYYND